MKIPKPQPEPHPEQKLAKAQADHWGAIAANPNLSPEAAWAFNLARSARASATLWGRPCSGREARDTAIR